MALEKFVKSGYGQLNNKNSVRTGGAVMKMCCNKRLVVTAFLFAASASQLALADWTGGTAATVSGTTHDAATFSASITTDSAGTGEYLLYFSLFKVGGSGVAVSNSPIDRTPVNGNKTTTFTVRATNLACGTEYSVSGTYLPAEGGTPKGVSSAERTRFSTLPCATLDPTSISSKVFTGTAIPTIVFTSTNFNGAPTFQVTPALPTGLVFDSSTGAISGTPTAAQTETRHIIRGSGAVSGTASATLALTVAPTLTNLEVLRYVASQPDLIDIFGTDIARARQHYLDWGFNEGRKITFIPLLYTASHADLIDAFGTDETKAVSHYIQSGYQEKRQVTFNALRYVASHSDLIEAIGVDADKAVRHYINYGFKEGRKVTFDPLRYIASNPDLISAFGGDETRAINHYIQYGFKEQRKATFSDLDALQFIASYGDLISGLGANVVAGIRNYVEVGYQSGRRILFDALTYIASHADLIAAFGSDAIAGVKHYIEHGYKEGRKVVFDALGYLAAHADLRAAFGTDIIAATRHFINSGSKEGRGYFWTVSATAGPGGAVSASRLYANTGERVSLTVTPQSGYAIDNVTGCGGSLNGFTYTTTPLTGTCSITATFRALSTTLTVVVQYQKAGPSAGSGSAPNWESPVTARIPYVWMELINSTNQIIGSGYADVDGKKDFVKVPTGTSYRVIIRSKALTPSGFDLWVVDNTRPLGSNFSTIRNRYDTHAVGSSPITLDTQLASQSITLTAPSGWNSTTKTLEDDKRFSGPFIIIADVVNQQLSAANAGAINTVKRLNILWSTKNIDSADEKNFDLGKDDGSGAYFLSCDPSITASGKPNIEGGLFSCAASEPHMVFLSGSQDASYSIMESSPTVTVHELTHFTQASSMREYSPGGSHSGNEYQDIAIAHHEGFATGAATLIAKSGRLETFTKRNQTIVSNVSDYSKRSFGSPVGWFQENNITSFIWSLFDPAGTVKLSDKEIYAPYYSTAWKSGTFVPNIWAYGKILKDLQPAKSVAIDQLASSWNITLAGNDVLGSAERIRGDRSDKQTFPVITSVPLSGTIEVCSAGKPYEYNKSSNRRYLQLAGDGTIRKYTVTGPENTVPILFSSDGSYFEKGKTSFTLTAAVPSTGDWASIGECKVAGYSSEEAENNACSGTAYTPPAEQCWTIKVE